MADLEKTAWVFPGQGSQSAGMGFDLYETFDSVKTVFHQADESLGFPISKMCFSGPEEALNLTINAQPALLTVSYACVKAIEEICNGGFIIPACIAGHSLGEYTALAVANVLDFPTTVFLARERGRLMHEAGQLFPGGMAAVMGMEEKVLQNICEKTSTVIANYNTPGQLVISGAKNDILKASEMAKEAGASRIVQLQVSGAFHSPLMKPAQEGLSAIIDTLDFRTPDIPIIANTTARLLTTTEEIRNELIDQLCTSVRWQQSVEYMINDGVTSFMEIGPGKVLTGLIKRINKDVTLRNVNNAEAVTVLFQK